MRKWAFAVAVSGMFVMILLISFLPVVEVGSYKELDGLKENVKVVTEGIVESERVAYETMILVLDNGIEVVFRGGERFGSKKIRVEGKVGVYGGRKQIVAEKVLFLEVVNLN